MTLELTEQTGTQRRARKSKHILTPASDAAGPAATKEMPFDYEKDVDDLANVKIISQAAAVVFCEQKVRVWT
jgi:hypothetical protein